MTHQIGEQVCWVCAAILFGFIAGLFLIRHGIL